MAYYIDNPLDLAEAMYNDLNSPKNLFKSGEMLLNVNVKIIRLRMIIDEFKEISVPTHSAVYDFLTAIEKVYKEACEILNK